MSLFKVRDFWTFDLDALRLQTSGETTIGAVPDTNNDCVEGTFTACAGHFASIGQHDVFVCGDLRGFIYVIQVPVADQRMHFKYGGVKPELESSKNISSTEPNQPLASLKFDDRQLLAATQLNFPIVDIKCGFFTSALKQTVAALSFDRISILQVNRQKISESNLARNRLSEYPHPSFIHDNLLSHEFEEYIRLDLLKSQFASSLVILNTHSESSLSESARKDASREVEPDLQSIPTHGEDTIKGSNRNRSVVQQLHLPQRDKLMIQYTNQFLFTLIDSKKIIGHFTTVDWPPDGKELDQNELKMQQMSQAVGNMPMAYLHSDKLASSLIMSFSNHRIYCIPMDSLITLAKQQIMKKVAQNLLRNENSSGVSEKPSSFAYANSENLKADESSSIINVKINTVSQWSHELIELPLQMSSLRRRAKSQHSASQREEFLVSQLLVMSRYNIDLFTASGQHIWSQRFETPLIHTLSYTVDSDGQDTERPITIDGGKQGIQFKDYLVTLICADSLAAGKSNMMIFKEDRVNWSALLNAKPSKIWRVNLTHMPGLLALLDIKQNQLIVSYLGTDADGTNDESQNLENETAGAQDITKLEAVHQSLFENEFPPDGRTDDAIVQDQRERLAFGVNLDASGSWPDVRVDISAQLRLDSLTTGVIHDIFATLEYDDLLRFDFRPSDDQSISMISFPSQGVARIALGNCWPDRRDPILLNGTFNLLNSSSASFGAKAMDDLEIDDERGRGPIINQKLVPKSLKVKVLLSYRETHSSMMVQGESFLLPISMISQLIHIDYTNGSGQNLDDVFNNLDHYSGSDNKNDSSRPHHFCDLFVQLNCDLVGWLDEIAERDLVCRSSATRNEQRNRVNRQVETLENINLLAQSLDCRLRYKNPIGMIRQSSEELVVPVMASFAMRFDNTHETLLPVASDNAGVIVWVHACSLTPHETPLTEELVAQHMKDWTKYAPEGEAMTERAGLQNNETNNLLISIECDKPLPLIAVLDHLLERTRSLTSLDTRTALRLIETNDLSNYENVYNTITGGHHLAISKSLNDSLRDILVFYETNHKGHFKRLTDKLARDYRKFHIATTTILSIMRRLPALPDDMSESLENLSYLIKLYQQEIMSTLSDLCSLKEADYIFSKLPCLSTLKIKRSNDHGFYQSWPEYDMIVD